MCARCGSNIFLIALGTVPTLLMYAGPPMGNVLYLSPITLRKEKYLILSTEEFNTVKSKSKGTQ